MLKVLQIVKRFGPVGGMERYVWELSHALAELGVEVHVVCEQSPILSKHTNIYTHILGINPPKPRWLSMLQFSHQVEQWVDKNKTHSFIIHSHERTSSHHVTTFHSTLFANIRQKQWWKRLSLRVAVWLYLEKRELCSKHVKAVLPNSDLIYAELQQMYPCIGERLNKPAYPATHPIAEHSTDKKKAADKKIIFVGQEWQRKGLEKAVQIVKAIRESHPNLLFLVLGPKPDDIQHLFNDWQDGYQLLGWEESLPHLKQADLLLHPATAEAYGMAIAEASNVGVPVVISDQCGIASQVTEQSGQVLMVESSIEQWADTCINELNRTSTVTTIGKNWQELAKQHIDIYNQITTPHPSD